jgi:hypothetical protein
LKKPKISYELWLGGELKGTFDTENDAEEFLYELLQSGIPGSDAKIVPIEVVVKKRKKKNEDE